MALRGGTNRDDTRAVQAALARLGAQLGDTVLGVAVDGAFGLGTEAAVSALQRRAYLPETGIVDHTTLSALNDTLAAHGLACGTITGPPGGAGLKGAVELHFYPSDAERKLYVVKDGKVLDRFGTVGGQNRTVDDPNNPTVDYGPSPAGTYAVVRVSPHVSTSWGFSYVPYGAPPSVTPRARSSFVTPTARGASPPAPTASSPVAIPRRSPAPTIATAPASSTRPGA